MGFRQNRERVFLGEEQAIERTCGMFKEFEALSDVLLGYETKPGVMSKPCKLSIWTEGTVVKFCVNDEEFGRVGFGTLDTSMRIDAALCEALDAGNIEWKDRQVGNHNGPRKNGRA